MKRIYLYKRFERFWHWTQAALIIMLMITGLEIHGSFALFGFEKALMLHNALAWSLITLIIFAIFWHFTTGEWKQYIPTTKYLSDMIKFYTSGIFKGEPHPVKKTELSKLNPLQRLTYLVLKLVLIPIQVASGLVYIFWGDIFTGKLGTVAALHTIGAFALIAFVIVHVYMTTTGHTVFSNIKAMITGWEEIEEE